MSSIGNNKPVNPEFQTLEQTLKTRKSETEEIKSDVASTPEVTRKMSEAIKEAKSELSEGKTEGQKIAYEKFKDEAASLLTTMSQAKKKQLAALERNVRKADDKIEKGQSIIVKGDKVLTKVKEQIKTLEEKQKHLEERASRLKEKKFVPSIVSKQYQHAAKKTADTITEKESKAADITQKYKAKTHRVLAKAEGQISKSEHEKLSLLKEIESLNKRSLALQDAAKQQSDFFGEVRGEIGRVTQRRELYSKFAGSYEKDVEARVRDKISDLKTKQEELRKLKTDWKKQGNFDLIYGEIHKTGSSQTLETMKERFNGLKNEIASLEEKIVADYKNPVKRPSRLQRMLNINILAFSDASPLSPTEVPTELTRPRSMSEAQAQPQPAGLTRSRSMSEAQAQPAGQTNPRTGVRRSVNQPSAGERPQEIQVPPSQPQVVPGRQSTETAFKASPQANVLLDTQNWNSLDDKGKTQELKQALQRADKYELNALIPTLKWVNSNDPQFVSRFREVSKGDAKAAKKLLDKRLKTIGSVMESKLEGKTTLNDQEFVEFRSIYEGFVELKKMSNISDQLKALDVKFLNIARSHPVSMSDRLRKAGNEYVEAERATTKELEQQFEALTQSGASGPGITAYKDKLKTVIKAKKAWDAELQTISTNDPVKRAQDLSRILDPSFPKRKVLNEATRAYMLTTPEAETELLSSMESLTKWHTNYKESHKEGIQDTKYLFSSALYITRFAKTEGTFVELRKALEDMEEKKVLDQTKVKSALSDVTQSLQKHKELYISYNDELKAKQS